MNYRAHFELALARLADKCAEDSTDSWQQWRCFSKCSCTACGHVRRESANTSGRNRHFLKHRGHKKFVVVVDSKVSHNIIIIKKKLTSTCKNTVNISTIQRSKWVCEDPVVGNFVCVCVCLCLFVCVCVVLCVCVGKIGIQERRYEIKARKGADCNNNTLWDWIRFVWNGRHQRTLTQCRLHLSMCVPFPEIEFGHIGQINSNERPTKVPCKGRMFRGKQNTYRRGRTWSQTYAT